jgi:hypothetical protein
MFLIFSLADNLHEVIKIETSLMPMKVKDMEETIF